MPQSTIAWSLADLQTHFLCIRERIETHARIFFRHIRCWCKRADFIAEAIGLAWKWFKRLAQQGKDATQFPATLASYATRAVKSGRRVAGQVKSRDAMNEGAQRRHDFSVGKLPDFSTLSENPLAEALIDNTRSPILDQVQFRIDFPSWLTTRTERDRRIVRDMAFGERARFLCQKHGICPARVSQLRREFRHDWLRFCDELPSKN